jgi:glutathione peroxidase
LRKVICSLPSSNCWGNAVTESIYEIPVTTIDGRITTLEEYSGRVLLIVNVASQCTLTRQYASLEDLYRRYKDRGLTVLAFPCNQFLKEEPGDEGEIQRFCRVNYGVSFPLFAKIDVNGASTHPLYQLLKAAKKGTFGTSLIKWNFTKFLVNREGEVVRRLGPSAGGDSLEKELLPLLDSKPVPG